MFNLKTDSFVFDWLNWKYVDTYFDVLSFNWRSWNLFNQQRLQDMIAVKLIRVWTTLLARGIGYKIKIKLKFVTEWSPANRSESLYPGQVAGVYIWSANSIGKENNRLMSATATTHSQFGSSVWKGRDYWLLLWERSWEPKRSLTWSNTSSCGYSPVGLGWWAGDLDQTKWTRYLYSWCVELSSNTGKHTHGDQCRNSDWIDRAGPGGFLLGDWTGIHSQQLDYGRTAA